MITLSVTRHSVERYTTSTRITDYMRIINMINSFPKTIIISRYAKISIKSNGLE